MAKKKAVKKAVTKKASVVPSRPPPVEPTPTEPVAPGTPEKYIDVLGPAVPIEPETTPVESRKRGLHPQEIIIADPESPPPLTGDQKKHIEHTNKLVTGEPKDADGGTDGEPVEPGSGEEVVIIDDPEAHCPLSDEQKKSVQDNMFNVVGDGKVVEGGTAFIDQDLMEPNETSVQPTTRFADTRVVLSGGRDITGCSFDALVKIVKEMDKGFEVHGLNREGLLEAMLEVKMVMEIPKPEPAPPPVVEPRPDLPRWYVFRTDRSIYKALNGLNFFVKFTNMANWQRREFRQRLAALTREQLELHHELYISQVQSIQRISAQANAGSEKKRTLAAKLAAMDAFMALIETDEK